MTTSEPRAPESPLERRLMSTPLLLWCSFVCAGLFVVLAILARHPDLFYHSVARAINRLTLANSLVADGAFAISGPELQGIIVVVMLCCCWIAVRGSEQRARLLAGILAAILAGVIAQAFAMAVLTSPKPLFDHVVDFQVPATLPELGSMKAEGPYGNGMHTFPSPRTALYAGIAMAIGIVQPVLGLLALSATLSVELARILIGLHYFTDIVGSVLLAAATVSASQFPKLLSATRRVVHFGSRRPVMFYACFLVVLIEPGMSFENVRQMLRQVQASLHL